MGIEEQVKPRDLRGGACSDQVERERAAGWAGVREHCVCNWTRRICSVASDRSSCPLALTQPPQVHFPCSFGRLPMMAFSRQEVEEY